MNPADIIYQATTAANDLVDAFEEKKPYSFTTRVTNAIKSVQDVDEYITMQIATMPSLGGLEYLISFPGNLFGIPIFACNSAAMVIAALAEYASPSSTPSSIYSVSMLALVYVVMTALFWAYCCFESNDPRCNADADGILRAFAPLGKKYGTLTTLISPQISMFVLGFFSPTAQKAAGYYLALYLATQVVFEFFKATARRMRPVGRKEHELKDVRRELPQIQYFLRRQHALYSSFPSSDAGGAAIFAVVGIYVTPFAYWKIILALWCVPYVAMFSRLYFHAHFVIDVIAGFAMSLAVFSLWSSYLKVEEFSWIRMSITEIIVILTWGAIQKLKPHGENIYNTKGLFLKKQT